MSLSKERREELRNKLAQVPSEFVPAARVSELRALLDLADERDRYRDLLRRARKEIDDPDPLSRLDEEIDAALEGKS